MQSASEISAFDRGIRPVMKIVLPEKAEEIVGFRADPNLLARIEELARKSTEGELNDSERAEMRVTRVRISSLPSFKDRRAR